MFCPKCRKAYREGFYRCADCGIGLVNQLPTAWPEDAADSGFVEIYSTYNQGDIAFIKSVLEGENITYYFQGDNPSLLVAAGAYARLLVKTDEADRAREILRESGFL